MQERRNSIAHALEFVFLVPPHRYRVPLQAQFPTKVSSAHYNHSSSQVGLKFCTEPDHVIIRLSANTEKYWENGINVMSEANVTVFEDIPHGNSFLLTISAKQNGKQYK